MSTITTEPEEQLFTCDELNYYIETYTGKKFKPSELRGEYLIDFSILDISHALSLETRYGGHCTTFYSVAEHSCHVFDLWKVLNPNSNPRTSLYVLLHDAHEAYFKDMPYPIKKLFIMESYRKMCDLCQKKILDRFNATPESLVSNKNKAVLKKIDIYLRYVESKKLMVTGGKDWDWPRDKNDYIIYKEIEQNEAYSEKIEYPVNLKLWAPLQAREEFIKRFMECWS